MEKKNIINVKLGKDVKIFDFVNLYGCAIDDNTKIGTFVEIQKNASIGKNCKISSHTFICEGVYIEDNVFVGHNVTFINDKHPRSVNEDGIMQTESNWEVIETFVKKGASIGSSSTILCGVTIGENAIVDAAPPIIDPTETNDPIINLEKNREFVNGMAMKSPLKQNAFMASLNDAKENNKDTFEVGGEIFDVT